jgi:hypothetical protein
VRATIEALLRRWDLMVSELPPAGELSTAERLHAPLSYAIPAVGVRRSIGTSRSSSTSSRDRTGPRGTITASHRRLICSG